MSWFRKKKDDRVDEDALRALGYEKCPTFLVNRHDEIVEVAYTWWEQTGPGDWLMRDGGHTVTLSEDVDRMIVELPAGCFEQSVSLRGGKGFSATFIPSSDAGPGMNPCQRHASFAPEFLHEEDAT